jgi:pilus assembly protein CpaF
VSQHEDSPAPPIPPAGGGLGRGLPPAPFGGLPHHPQPPPQTQSARTQPVGRAAAPVASVLSPFGSPGGMIPSPPSGEPNEEQGKGLSEEARRAAMALLELIGDDESSEVILNGPNEVMCKVAGARYHVEEIKFEDAATYHQVLNEYLLAYTDTADRIDGVNMLVEGQMELPSDHPGRPPMLARVHILCPPLVAFAKVTLAKKARLDFTLDRLAGSGAMTLNMAEWLKAVALGRITIVVSGPTGAGKSTILQALTHHFDQNDRVILIEDTPELRLPIADTVYLCSTSLKPGAKPEDVVSTEWLVKAANRMRMDRIILGEVRGAEMAEWLIAANSGAEGSATTVHADNPRRALDKMLALATKSPTSGSESTLRREIAATVQLVIQAGLVDGRHRITHIEEISNQVRHETGVIASTTLFEFDRSVGRHVVRHRPSDDLMNLLRQRGISVNPSWFAGAI